MKDVIQKLKAYQYHILFYVLGIASYYTKSTPYCEPKFWDDALQPKNA